VLFKAIQIRLSLLKDQIRINNDSNGFKSDNKKTSSSSQVRTDITARSHYCLARVPVIFEINNVQDTKTTFLTVLILIILAFALTRRIPISQGEETWRPEQSLC